MKFTEYLNNIFWHKNITKTRKLKIYGINEKVLYGCETWTIDERSK